MKKIDSKSSSEKWDVNKVVNDGQDILPSTFLKVEQSPYYHIGEAPYYPPGFIHGHALENLESRLSFLTERANSGKGDSDRHLLTLFSIALSSHARNILELGVRRGDTTLPLLMAAKFNSGVVDSVDISDTEFKCPEDLEKYWNFHKSDAIAFLSACVKQGRKFDFIYLDDWHEYSHVKKELELIDQLVSPKGIILIHDLMYGGTEPFYHCDLTDSAGKQWAKGGPYRAVAELPGQFWEFSTLPYNNGLTLLRKKYSSKYFNN